MKMGKLSHTENARLLGQRISQGKITQYFNTLSRGDAQKLAKAKNDDDFDEVATILQNNLTSYARPFEIALQEAYDDEIQSLATKILGNYVDEIEADVVESFKEVDIETIRNLKEKMDFEFSQGLKGRAEQIKRQLELAIKNLSTPEILRREVKRLIKRKNKSFEDVRKSKVVRWGRYGKLALLTWGVKGVITLKYLEKPKPKIKKQSLEFIPTKKEWGGKSKDQILSRKDQPFSIKERLFFQARKNKKEKEVYDDYLRVFGKVRNPSELKKGFQDFK